ncbi:uncharacterized protein LOC132835315 [Hemiscyllium ocellatum]|uniref:uncharacterized protein LOC132835315 n=1 Tax=Hemiscyllium ocellatum TaxID=170820 RepID=UPI002967241B|nr:uncharacterized protein LOC132835315 [Hemiscyllium ocellatum]
MVSRYEPEAGRRWRSSAGVSNWACAMNLEHSLQQTVPHWMEVYEEAPPRLQLSSHAAQRRRPPRDGSCSTPTLELHRLPSPRELYGRRKGKRRLPSERRALAVLYHLEELKRRQAGIDQLKALRWSAERSQDSEHLDTLRTDNQATDPTNIGDCLTNADLEDRELFFQPRWKFGVPEQRLVPEDTPYLAFCGPEPQEKPQPFSFFSEVAQEDKTFWNVKHCAEE